MTAPDTTVDALLRAIECHSLDQLRSAIALLPDANAPVRGKTPVQWLLEMYMRSERFGQCLQLLLDHGGTLPDPRLTNVLRDDPTALRQQLRDDPSLLTHRADMVSAFTSLRGASLLHIAAEYGNASAAKVLLEAGAYVEARAATDALGGDGQTPLFHTVSSLLDHGAPVMQMLLAAGARTDVRLQSLCWGRGFPWETTLFDVTPISFCQAGLLPQMHRGERDIYANLTRLLTAAKRSVPPLTNVPNQYLTPRRR